MGPEIFDALKEKIDTPAGMANAFNLFRLKDIGYEVDSLPFSIRVLLENAMRHSRTVHGALEAAHSLARWPASVGSELPFMPYRVLLQDYTGVPLIVDLAAMRDAAKSAGFDPKSVNSGVPVDLVIDHSIQVDAWGDEFAFEVNLEKEYERNSERYSLLKWAQSSFKNLRVFPPGKGICHQFNLEYLSKVFATGETGGVLSAFPDTLVGTDSHTTMVNGLGCLGWGVGGIEAEAVMLGEPYHMPIPKVLGVKLTGSLSEGVTPTDLVLTVTEKLRAKNVVGYFVEYFGDGYRHLTVPDRATIGNMSPEYGATSGFCPVDESTFTYLAGTARPPAHVDFVRRFATSFGYLASDIEPKYSEVLNVDLSAVEPSVAGPRNPEERRSLRAMPRFAPSLYGYKPAPPDHVLTSSEGGRSQLMETEDGPIRAGVSDGAVVIAAITSCTNTSNPTVMVGAGLIAKKAAEFGLSVKPWVKPSLAPGSTVVTDYLEKADLMKHLDALGFNLVGLGCTTCVAEGTPVLLSNGTSIPIESMPPNGGRLLFAPTPKAKLGIARQLQKMDRGVQDCVTLVLQDGRKLVVTPDHQLLCSDGRWVRADGLRLGMDRVVIGLESPVDFPEMDEKGFTLTADDFRFDMKTDLGRSKLLAFSRLLGFLLGDGSISRMGQGRLSAGQWLDRENILDDIELITGQRPKASMYDERRWSVVLPTKLAKAMSALEGVQVGKRIIQPTTLPAFVLGEDCPVSVLREFLGGLFGADGHSPALKKNGEDEADATIVAPAFSRSTIIEHLDTTKRFMHDLTRLLSKCGVNTDSAPVYVYQTRRSESTYKAALDGLPRLEVRLLIGDGLAFVERVGYRYCVEKSMRATAAAVYWRTVKGINDQRQWMASRLRELHVAQPAMSFAKARQSVAQLLLQGDAPDSIPPVVVPHYALLEGCERFSRLPKEESRTFQPLHRDSCGFPSPAKMMKDIGAFALFTNMNRGTSENAPRNHAFEKGATSIPTLSLMVFDRRSSSPRRVYDLHVANYSSFIAGTVAVHNCIGNSGPLAKEVETSIKERDVYSVAVLSGNRNFDGRIHPLVRASFLMSPMLVVAYALAGRIDFDFSSTPLGPSRDGKPVYLKDLWPTLQEIKEAVNDSLSPELYSKRYADAMKGDERWDGLTSFSDDVYHWDEASTYIRQPGWFGKEESSSAKADIHGARAIALLEDKVTTDHISPAGTILFGSPAGDYLNDHGVDLAHFSTYGSRRGNHEVMVRGGFSNIRLKNLLAEGKEGGFTKHFPDGKVMPIFDASIAYAKEQVPLIVLAGKQYGSGSSRDWAAKAPKLLGIRAVMAESYERIHRSNLVAMGVVPLQFKPGENAKSFGLSGDEVFDVVGLATLSAPRQEVEVVARGKSGEKKFKAVARVDNETEMKYLENGGVLPYVFSRLHTTGH